MSGAAVSGRFAHRPVVAEPSWSHRRGRIVVVEPSWWLDRGGFALPALGA